MSGDLTLRHLDHYVQETVNFLISKLARDQTVSPPIAGWHNFFKPERIGTTGSAVPLLFLSKVNADFSYRQEVVNKLLTSQFVQGSWAVLSLADTPTVEGTAWPLRALAIAGDSRARSAVFRAEEWLLSQQSEQGAWGSTIENPPRTLLTAISVESLASLTSPSRDAIIRAIRWFGQSQRPDGSWGEEPGGDGTVFHTAVVTNALLEIGLPPSDPRIAAGVSFLKTKWVPNSRNFLQEIYDVHFDGIYSRDVIEPDIDSAAIGVLRKVRPSWATPTILNAVHEMVELYLQGGRLSPPNLQPSIWNIIPRATLFFELLKSFPVAEDGRVLSFPETIMYSPSHLSKRSVVNMLLRRIVIPRFRLTSIFLLVFVAITSVVGYLYYTGSVRFSDVILSLFVELAGLSLTIYVDRKLAKNG